MIKHPSVGDSNFDILIDIAIKDAELTGYVSKNFETILQLFSWIYIQEILVVLYKRH
jgi:hypothetical protein